MINGLRSNNSIEFTTSINLKIGTGNPNKSRKSDPASRYQLNTMQIEAILRIMKQRPISYPSRFIANNVKAFTLECLEIYIAK